MIDFLMLTVVRLTLWLRYRIRVRGLDAIKPNGRGGILFLPNHPGLIDPIIFMSVTFKRFRPRALADEKQIDRFLVRWLARRAGTLPIPDMAAAGHAGRVGIEKALVVLAECLSQGRNALLYPAGRVMRQRLGDLGGNSAVQQVLDKAPDTQVVLVRTSGLWGSRFSWASGQSPNVARALWKGALSLLASGIFFAPRREVTLEFHPVADDPQARDAFASGDRSTINRYLESFYNAGASHNTHVPYSIWERGGARQVKEPQRISRSREVNAIPAATRRIVSDYLSELAGVGEMQPDDLLGRDLGLDSLARSEVLIFLGKEFGYPQGDIDSIRTVGDVMLAAVGEALGADPTRLALKPISPKWFVSAAERRAADPVSVPKDATGGIARNVVEAFLAQARRRPGRPVVADQTSGVKTYRDLVTAMMVLRPAIEQLPGDRVAIMLPASVAANVVYLSVLVAGKTPVMVNWTVGQRNMIDSLNSADVQAVITARALVARVESQGGDFGQVAERFVYLEDLASSISRRAKLWAAVRSRFSWRSLDTADVSATAAILFTSGSETTPKAVPLSHANVLTNLHDAMGVFHLWPWDRMLSFLPPFHSFGLTVGMLAPLCLGVAAVYHPNPNEPARLAKIIEAYKATIMMGTPTFLNGIAQVATGEQLASARLGVTGAEKCPLGVYDLLAERCPKMTVVEGYGVTECSPIIAFNEEQAPVRGSIGKVMPSYEYVLVGAEDRIRVEPGRPGLLLVRGPCVFGGYLAVAAGAPPSPFVEFEDKQWYNTGDLVSENADGVLTFCGRLKRFVKIGGEMISLPAIEAALDSHYPRAQGEGPTIAVEATEEDPHNPGRVELVLFATQPTDRQRVNGEIRRAGLSALYNIRRVIPLDEIPILGTGKTDYRRLKKML